MARTYKGLYISRLIVLASIFAIPVVVFIIFFLGDFNLWYSDNALAEFLVLKLLCPLTFSVSWFYFISLLKERVANTIDAMDRVTSIIPLRLKIFYGMIALVVLFIFVFPLLTPVICVLSFMSMAWHVSTQEHDFSEGGIPFITKLLIGLAVILALFCTISIIPQYISLFTFLFTGIWLYFIEHIYIFSYCLCTSLAIGSVFFMYENKGVSEYEDIFTSPSASKEVSYVKYVEFILFIFFLFLAYLEIELIILFYWSGFIIVTVVGIINLFTSKEESGKYSGHILGYLLAAIFMGSNVLSYFLIAQIIESISLITAALVFIIIFLLTFILVEEEGG